MIITGRKIVEEVELGNIHIYPFDKKSINPNSYNYSLGSELVVFGSGEISLNKPKYERVPIPKGGYLLLPRKLYLGVTREIIGSKKYATSLIGRSTIGRLGIWLQVTADLGHIGNNHRWTLELKTVQPVRVFPNMKIGQITFWSCYGKATRSYDNKYAKDFRPTLSKLNIHNDPYWTRD